MAAYYLRPHTPHAKRNFTNRPKKYHMVAKLALPGLDTSPGTRCRLGVYLDPQLTWTAHINHIQSSIFKRLGALTSLGNACGFTLLDLRKIYITTILPRVLYCCSAWYTPNSGRFTVGLIKRTVQLMNGIQWRGAKAVVGAFMSTARSSPGRGASSTTNGTTHGTNHWSSACALDIRSHVQEDSSHYRGQ